MHISNANISLTVGHHTGLGPQIYQKLVAPNTERTVCTYRQKNVIRFAECLLFSHCIDINECEMNEDTCNDQAAADCINTNGSYECISANLVTLVMATFVLVSEQKNCSYMCFLAVKIS